jgi:outer membrane protein TolC
VKQRYFLIPLMVWMMAAPVAALGQSLTLAQCLAYAYDHNPSLKAAHYQVAATQDHAKSIRADFLPALSTSYGYSRVGSQSAKGPTDQDYLDQYARNFSLRLSQMLFAGYRIMNSYDKARLDIERTRFDRELARLELAYNIQIVFFELMNAKEDLQVAEESVERLVQGVAAARAFFEKQLISHAEVLTAEVDLAHARQQVSMAKNAVNRSRIALFALMNMPVDPVVSFVNGLDFYQDPYPDEFDECWQQARDNRPDIDSLEMQVAMLEKDVAIAGGKYLPRVQLELGYHDQDRDYDQMAATMAGDVDRDQRNRYWTAGVTASWDLFDGGRAWYGRKRSLNQINGIKEQITEIQLAIQEGIRKALFTIAEARERTRVAQAAVAAARETYAMEERRLTAGLIPVSMLLDAQIRLARAQGDHARARLDYQLGRAELGFMMGEAI